MEGRILLCRQRPSPADAHHLVAASLELIWNGLQRNHQAQGSESLPDRLHKRGPLSIERQQRKNPDLARHATELAHRLSMEIRPETFAVEKEEMRTERQIQSSVRKRQIGQGRRNI